MGNQAKAIHLTGITMKERIELWRHAFSGDQNSIDATLTTFSWNLAVFQTVVKAVELTPEDHDGNKPLNGMILELLRNTYWGSALLAIRRLVDRGNINGKKGVVSLRSILNDARLHREKITRRVFVEDIAGLAYDPDEFYKSAPTVPENGNLIAIPHHLCPSIILLRHETFDFLSGKNPDNRRSDDLIDEKIFDKLESRIAKLDDIADHATIHFAHAATDVSRQGRGIGPWGLSQTLAALKILVETAELIGRWFAHESLSTVLPTPQYDQFSHVNQPLFPIDDTSALEAEWAKFSDMTEEWIAIEDTEL